MRIRQEGGEWTRQRNPAKRVRQLRLGRDPCRQTACQFNPRLGSAREADWRPVISAAPKRVAIVGAGPGGLEAAWTAAAAGHTVTLFGRSPDAGGAYRLETLLPGRAEIGDVIEHQMRLCRLYGVEMRLGEMVDAATIRSYRPDAVVLATGSDERPADEWMSIKPQMRVTTRRRSCFGARVRRTAGSPCCSIKITGRQYTPLDLLAERFGVTW